MEKVFLGLGSNIGNKIRNIEKSIELLNGVIEIRKIGRIYRSRAVGFENQPDFFNTAVMGFTELDIFNLFYEIKKIEKLIGRKERFRWGPREIDIDILFYGDGIYKTDDLTVPHPRLQERDFVLKPLLDLDPDFVHPVLKKKISELYEEVEFNSIVEVVR
ncbi:2-amino-4-hydroxy-6-hydroxymethyldihydropteridine diphosphokinase [Persephonella sp.]